MSRARPQVPLRKRHCCCETSGGSLGAMQPDSSHQQRDRPTRHPQQTRVAQVVCLPNMFSVDLATRKQPDRSTPRDTAELLAAGTAASQR